MKSVSITYAKSVYLHCSSVMQVSPTLFYNWWSWGLGKLNISPVMPQSVYRRAQWAPMSTWSSGEAPVRLCLWFCSSVSYWVLWLVRRSEGNGRKGVEEDVWEGEGRGIQRHGEGGRREGRKCPCCCALWCGCGAATLAAETAHAGGGFSQNSGCDSWVDVQGPCQFLRCYFQPRALAHRTVESREQANVQTSSPTLQPARK